MPSLRTLEVHLPQLIRCLPREALHRRPMTILLPHQALAQQHPMNGHDRQFHSLPPPQHLQFARSPIRALAPQLRDPLLHRRRRTPGHVLRTTAVLAQPFHSPRLISPQPQISRGPRNPKLPAQLPQVRPRLTRPNHKTHALILHVHCSPWHPALREGWPYFPALASLGRKCKGCCDNNV